MYKRIFAILFVIFWQGTTMTDARSLEEIQKSGEIRLCVAGSSHELYAQMGTAFAESLGLTAKVRRLNSWDQQFQNKEGITLKEESYTPHLMKAGECDIYPNDLVMHAWREKKLDFVVLFRTRMNAVDSKTADFTIIGADGAFNWTRNKVKNSIVAFFVGPVTQLGWGFQKKDTDLQDAVRKFFDSQRKVNSRFDAIWKEKVGMSLSEYTLFITNLIGE